MRRQDTPPPQPSARDAAGVPSWLPLVEATLVGSAMLADRDDVLSLHLDPSDFHVRSYSQVWRAISSIVAYGGVPSVPAVIAELTERGQLEAIGGETTLQRLTGEWMFIHAGKPSLVAHAAMVKREAAGRNALKAAQGIARRAFVTVPITEHPDYQDEMP